MSKYQILLNILDHMSAEARAAGFTKYFSDRSDEDELNRARSRAYIHLFLKVKFGLLEATEREQFITDGTQDGGIDGYFIDRDKKIVYFLQSKFRANQSNFENKTISLEEIVVMDIARIASGHDGDHAGIDYNGKIKKLMRDIRELPDIARYSYKVILVANIAEGRAHILQKFTDGYPTEVFDSDRCYSELVFPVISGTYYDEEDLHILLDLSNKNAGAKISYEVGTELVRAR